MRNIIILLLISSGAFSQKVIVQSTVIGLPDSLLSKEQLIPAPNTIKKYMNGYKVFASFNTDSITEGSTNLYYTNSHGLGTVLTGYTSGAGTVSSSDNILQAIQKLNGNDGLKQNALSGTGLVSFSGTTPSYNTTSSSISNILSDELGSGKMIFSAGTLDVVTGKTLTSSNTLTLAGTDGSTLNVGTGGTLGTNAYTSTAYLPLAGSAYTTTTGNGLDINSSTLTTGNLLSIGLTGTAATSNTKTGLSITSSGANGTASQTVTGQTISVTNTGTTNTNVGLNVTASGATNNYAALFTGSVGIGVASPSAFFHVFGTTRQLQLGYDASNYLTATVASNGTTTFALAGTSPVFSFSQNAGFGGTIFAGNISNSSNSNNSLINVAANGFTVSRNVADANPSTTITQTNASSTGNILNLNNNSGTVASIGRTGIISAVQFKLSALNAAPSSSSDTGATGEIRIVNGFIYVCVATNTWQRAVISTF